MVCQRCIWAVKKVLKQNDIDYHKVSLGTIVLNQELSNIQFDKLEEDLQEMGFEILLQKEQATVNRIKSLLIEKLQQANENTNISAYLSAELSTSYEQLSRLFSQVNGTTIEKYFNSLRIEKAKELLHYGELGNAQIAYELAYSNPAHFSSSFKSATGLTPTEFKSLKPKRDGLAEV